MIRIAALDVVLIMGAIVSIERPWLAIVLTGLGTVLALLSLQHAATAGKHV